MAAPPDGLALVRFEGTPPAGWDAFVAAHPRAAFPYLSGHLAALAATTGYRVRGALFRRDGAVRGIYAWVRQPLRRHAVALPFYEYGGPLLAADATREEVAALLTAGGPAELRVAHGWDGPAGLVGRQVLHPFATLALDPDPELVLAGCDRQVRKALRKAERSELVVRQANSRLALTRDFLPAYRRWMRDRHGTPPLSDAYWLAVHDRLRPHWHLFQAWHGDRLAAQLLGFAVGQRVVITQTISAADDWSLRPNDLTHWAFVAWACRHGLRWFDFGSARYEGQRRFKEKWGCSFGVLEQVTWPPRAAASLAPEGRAADLARRLWRRLPLAWTARLGPPLRAWLTH